MPIFGFHCDACENEFETLVTSFEITACPECESTKLTRQLSRIARPRAGDSDAGASSMTSPAMSSGPCCGGGACRH
ncbi:MAG: zinc ribbon domain-containing protein [Proteobacteria bacterium]|nr:zinc ribbon domain-containing protein [Pseudomonadota bacterium]